MNTLNTCNCNYHTLHETLHEALDAARREHPTWWAEYEDSNLSVPRSVDAQLALDLALSAPSPLLRGLVWGLYLNN